MQPLVDGVNKMRSLLPRAWPSARRTATLRPPTGGYTADKPCENQTFYPSHFPFSDPDLRKKRCRYLNGGGTQYQR